MINKACEYRSICPVSNYGCCKYMCSLYVFERDENESEPIYIDTDSTSEVKAND